METVTKVFSLAQGFMNSQILFIFAKYNFADFLKDGPKSGEELAKLAKTNEDYTLRVLRAASSLGIVSRDPSSLLFSLNDVSTALLDGPASLKWLVLHWDEKPSVDAWLNLEKSMVGGSYPFHEVFGMNCFEYYAKNNESSDRFNKAMSAFTLGAPIPQELNTNYGFKNINHIVDIGGNQGTLAVGLMTLNPHLKSTVFDLPHVVDDGKKGFSNKEVESRINFVGGDFFSKVPSEGDLYIMKFIIHDWEDVKAIQILKTVRNSMPDTSKVVLLEHIVRETEDVRGNLLDLHMLVLNNAKERTEKEFSVLFDRSGLKLTRVIPLPVSGIFAIEAEKVGVTAI